MTFLLGAADDIVALDDRVPGLTGLSQIKSKGAKRDLNVKINLDLMYIEKKNIFLYLKEHVCSRTKAQCHTV